MEIIIEGIIQSTSAQAQLITINLEVIRATGHVPDTMTITCDRAAYAAYFEQARVHKNTYMITRLMVEQATAISVQWIAIPAMTAQIQSIVSNHRRQRQLQTIANYSPQEHNNAAPNSARTTAHSAANPTTTSSHRHERQSTILADQPCDTNGTAASNNLANTPQQHPAGKAPAAQAHEPEAITARMKTSDIVLATLQRATGRIQQHQTASYKEHRYA
ncbi:hypothetical protein [Galliscardovia ingluviei]|uniref:hypothetical protein n=1 Tax=Galliscardovia ingluviei TaxID=1769422 RepID=UPI001667633F|nr:hypothetical protein [Galliscardovia ingluviei]